MPLHASAEIVTPAGTLGVGGGGGGGSQPMGSYFKREWTIHPPCASSGPIVSDSGLVAGDLSVTTGMVFIPWNQLDTVLSQPLFNFQGMVPAQAPANIITALHAISGFSSKTCMMNAGTPRWYFGNAGQYYNGNMDIRVGISSVNVVPVFYVGQGQISATTVDNHMLVQCGSQNMHLSSTPTAADGLPTTLTGGNGVYHRQIVNVRNEYKEYRFLAGANSYFLGVWVDTLAVITRPANKPIVFPHGVDSWQDGQTWLTDGYNWNGEYQCLPQCTVASFHTGMCHGTDGQGGTGELNPNGTTGGDSPTYDGNRSSMAGSDSRCNWRAKYFGPQYPTYADIGGWNDGSRLSTPYQANYATTVAARMTKTIAAHAALSNDCRFVNVGIQPVDISGTSDAKWLAALGQAEMPGLFPGVCLGHVPLMAMWGDTTTTGPRSIYCAASDGLLIHLRLIGSYMVCGYIWDKAAAFMIDDAFVAKTMAANVPIVSPPTS